MSYIIYDHISPSGKHYIGQTCRKAEERWGKNGSGYLRRYNDGRYRQPVFANAILEYGWDSFKHEILFHNCSKELADTLESAFIKYWKDLGLSYNTADGGNTPGTQKYFSEEEHKMAARLKSKKYRESHKEKVKAYEAAYYQEHKEERKAYNAIRGKIYREAHKEELIKAKKVYYEANKEKLKIWQAAYKEAHKEEYKAYRKAYAEANKEKIKAYMREYIRTHKKPHRKSL